ncbi:hypothetical protein COU75_02095 [Candidatus Peregrinibacteria bacterium CG10_big_fil_rev_8_21_14_0_10_42_8]|nr:MAG: hypothetical protein COU75_02095 [Candidatus Peregrinibacteria bacterium CG10_big_fil_rev_8_21_14_0_10_42_8]
MRIKPFLFIGTALLGLMVTLSMQDQSVPDIDGSASRIGAQTATMLSLETKEEVSNKAAQESYLRTAARTIITTKTVAPKQRLLAALDRPEITMNHKLIAHDVLMALPEQCRNTLKNFYVRYEKPDNRGLAGKSVMILDGTVPDAEFRALFVHESGHNWDLGCLTGTADSGKSSFSDGDEAIYKNDPSLGFYQISWLTSEVQRSTSRPEDFVSGYASYNIFEDFAESFAYFVLQNEQFAKRATENDIIARKYAWFRDTIFNGQIPQIAEGKSIWKGKAPWDITKLQYAWKPDVVNLAQK